MKTRQLIFAALATLLIGSALWSCNQDKTSTEPVETDSAQEHQALSTMPSGMPGAGGGMMDQLRAGCPMVVQGADVSVVDTDGGVALTFKTDTGDVADLRTRVRSMAQMYQMHQGKAGMMWHRMGGEGMGHGGRGMGGEGIDHMAGRGFMPAASDTVTDTDKGARLEFRPSDASQLDTLREHVRGHQERMHSGECWMAPVQPTKTALGEQK